MAGFMDFEAEQLSFASAEDALWVPVYTRPLHEFRLYEYFRSRGIPAYLPLVPDFRFHNVVKNGKPYSYKREIRRPMLRSYLFARLTVDERRELWKTNSINNVWNVSREEQPAFLEELRGLRMMEELAKSSKIEFKKEIQVNDRFVIEAPREFEGTRGYLVEKRKKFWWVVRLEFLGRYVDAEIDPSAYRMTKVE